MMETAKCKRLLYYNYIIIVFGGALLIILSIPV